MRRVTMYDGDFIFWVGTDESSNPVIFVTNDPRIINDTDYTYASLANSYYKGDRKKYCYCSLPIPSFYNNTQTFKKFFNGLVEVIEKSFANITVRSGNDYSKRLRDMFYAFNYPGYKTIKTASSVPVDKLNDRQYYWAVRTVFSSGCKDMDNIVSTVISHDTKWNGCNVNNFDDFIEYSNPAVMLYGDKYFNIMLNIYRNIEEGRTTRFFDIVNTLEKLDFIVLFLYIINNSHLHNSQILVKDLDYQDLAGVKLSIRNVSVLSSGPTHIKKYTDYLKNLSVADFYLLVKGKVFHSMSLTITGQDAVKKCQDFLSSHSSEEVFTNRDMIDLAQKTYSAYTSNLLLEPSRYSKSSFNPDEKFVTQISSRGFDAYTGVMNSEVFNRIFFKNTHKRYGMTILYDLFSNHGKFSREYADKVLGIFMEGDVGKWLSKPSSSEDLLKLMLSKIEPVKIYEIVQEVIGMNGTVLTFKQWEAFVKNYETYENTPASWWIHSIK